MPAQPGQLFREAWITGVRKHYPGDPSPAMVAPWTDTPDWERSCAAATEAMIFTLLDASDGAASHLTDVQKGQFVAACWNAQIYRHLPDPKPSYVAPWEQLPDWQQQVDSGIFDLVTHGRLAQEVRRPS